MRRRDVLLAGSTGIGLSLAGCTLGFSDPEPEVSADPSPPWSQDGRVYHPAHRVGMKLIDTAEHGDRTVALSYSYAERFWTVTGTRTQRVGIDDEYNAVHMMVSAWDTETQTVLPVGSGLRLRVERVKNGEVVTERAPWPMLSQKMGFHFGDNIYFPGQETFRVAVEVGATTIGRRGAFQGEFENSGTVTFEFDFRRGIRNEIGIQKFFDRRGSSGASQPMEMSMLPLSVAPPSEALPGRRLGEATSGDAVFPITATDSADGTYLAVCPRTPYNRYVLPLMSLSARIDRGGTTVFDGPLPAAVGPERGYHYGTTVDSVESGDELVVTVDSPPQVARHEGYESAFLEMSAVSVTV